MAPIKKCVFALAFLSTPAAHLRSEQPKHHKHHHFDQYEANDLAHSPDFFNRDGTHNFEKSEWRIHHMRDQFHHKPATLLQTGSEKPRHKHHHFDQYEANDLAHSPDFFNRDGTHNFEKSEWRIHHMRDQFHHKPASLLQTGSEKPKHKHHFDKYEANDLAHSPDFFNRDGTHNFEKSEWRIHHMRDEFHHKPASLLQTGSEKPRHKHHHFDQYEANDLAHSPDFFNRDGTHNFEKSEWRIHHMRDQFHHKPATLLQTGSEKPKHKHHFDKYEANDLAHSPDFFNRDGTHNFEKSEWRIHHMRDEFHHKPATLLQTGSEKPERTTSPTPRPIHDKQN